MKDSGVFLMLCVFFKSYLAFTTYKCADVLARLCAEDN